MPRKFQTRAMECVGITCPANLSQPINGGSSSSSSYERPLVDEGTALGIYLVAGYGLAFYFLTRLFK